MPRLCYLLLLLCLPCSAEVYTYLDEAGNRVYTDRPLRDNAEQVQLAIDPPARRTPAAAGTGTQLCTVANYYARAGCGDPRHDRQSDRHRQ